MQDFEQKIASQYNFENAIEIGMPTYNGKNFTDISVKIPTLTLNRHGLVAWATWTWKTKTIQKLLEQLSKNGISTVMMDIKWDISWVSMPGVVSEKFLAYKDKFGEKYTWNANGFPTEFFQLNWEWWFQFRATVTEFGPFLLSRVLGLSSVQSAVLSVIFKYADDNWLLLVDLQDLKSLLSYISQNKESFEQYGQISPATIQVIMRQIISLESQWASNFFGEKSLDINDLINVQDWQWQINIFRLMNSVRYPQLFSTAMISLLLELFYNLEEVGDHTKPKLVVVIDEAHALFKWISQELLEELETVMKLIRSKGVWIIFCTQNPTDIPDTILSQLGLKIQHALRAFTAKDQESIRKMSKNFPISEFYDVEKIITQLGIGEALVTSISENGQPTELVVTKIFPPESRMDTITDAELQSFLTVSPLYTKYSTVYNPESATEILEKKVLEIQKQNQILQQQKILEEEEKQRRRNPTIADTIIKTATKTIGAELARNIWTKVWWKKVWSVWAQIVRWILGSIFR